MRTSYGLLLLLGALRAWGAPVSLHYSRPDNAGCPDEAALRQLVAARLGSDPFVTDGISKVSVSIITGIPLQADVVLESPDTPVRRRNLTAADCNELIHSVAVTVALAVDPLLKKPTRVPVAAPAVEAPPPAPIAPAPATSATLPLRWSISAGASADVGTSATAQPTLRLEARARGDLFSLGLEGRFAMPVTTPLQQGALTTSAALGTLIPCLHYKWLAGCAQVSLGGLRIAGSGLASANQATVFHATAGLRAVFSVPLGSHFALGAMAEGQVPLTRASAVVGTEPVWTVPPIGGGLGAWVSLLL